jgi:hypothetical protein
MSEEQKNNKLKDSGIQPADNQNQGEIPPNLEGNSTVNSLESTSRLILDERMKEAARKELKDNRNAFKLMLNALF